MYANLMEAAWMDKGEAAMFRTFASQYIDNEDFHRWWYTASGVPGGHVPDNNPHECNNYQVNGGVDFDGYAWKWTPQSYQAEDGPQTERA
jgi:hypothetical protein